MDERSHPLWRIACVLVATVLMLPACSRGPRNFHNENDALRARNLELERTVEELQDALGRRGGELAALRQQAEGARPLADVTPPTLAALQLDRYTGPLDTNHDGADDLVRIYLRPLDQHGRVIPIEGTATASLVLLSDDAEPITLVRRDIDADTLRQAYRSGFTGTHYTLELPLSDELPEGRSSVALRLKLIDAATGADHTVTGAYHVTR